MSRIEDPFDAEEVAKRLGCEPPWLELGYGDHGCVHALEEAPKVLKLTGQAEDAAACLAIKHAQSRGLSHPAVPTIHRVAWMRYTLTDEKLSRPVENVPFYAIVRDEMQDLVGMSIPEELAQAWKSAAGMLGSAWRAQDRIAIDKALRSWEPHGNQLKEALSGLVWMRDEVGILVKDVRASNLGETKEGFVGVRDFGNALIPVRWTEIVKNLEFEPLPPGCPLDSDGNAALSPASI